MMSEKPTEGTVETDGADENIQIDYDVIETVDVGEGDEPTELPEELDLDYDEVPTEETAGE